MASVGFRWLDILEKEFDKAFVDLDLTVGELDSEEPLVVYNVRQKLCTLSSCFAQLTHKAQTIFQNSAKIEAELIHMRAELVDSKAKRELLDQELHTMLLQLHSTQLSKLPKPNGTLMAEASFKPDVTCIKKRLEDEIKKSPSHLVRTHSIPSTNLPCPLPLQLNPEFHPSLMEVKQLRSENQQLQQENASLRNSILSLNSEVYGAKLAAKYLDKELAGRIQQLQLLGREMRGDVRDKLWRQLESEILLQRHKTVVRECRRNSVLNGTEKSSTPAPSRTIVDGENFGDVRTVIVKRKSGQGLGISITGGREHGVPILVSELESNGPAALSGELYIGDAILSVNEKDLRQACHKEAVDILKQHCEECRLQVQYIAADDSDNSLEEDFHFRFFDNAVCDPNDARCVRAMHENTPTAPRTPDSVSFQSGGSTRDYLTADAIKSYQVSPEIQKVIDSLQTSADLANLSAPSNNNDGDYLTGNINLNQTTASDLILLDNQRHMDNYNCSSNSLNSENLSSPMQTSTDMFMDSEVASTDMASNDSHSPKTNDVAVKSQGHLGEDAPLYGSTETFSNTKSDQSLLNSSCDSSPLHKASREYKKSKKFKNKKYFGVKTLQSIFNKHEGYSDISSTASDCTEDLVDRQNSQKSPKKASTTQQQSAIKELQSHGTDKGIETKTSANLSEKSAKPEQQGVEETTYRYRTVLADTSPQFEENIHTFLSEIFMKNFQTPDTPEATATTSRMGTKRYLRVGKALRLCSNEEQTAPLNESEQRREKLLARYVYNSNSLQADGEGNPDFGTPV